jgi:lipooligosaccharide transport system ATP-binding protein
MSSGRIIAQGTPAELVSAHAGDQVLEVYGPPERLAEVSELHNERGADVDVPGRRHLLAAGQAPDRLERSLGS